MNDEVKEPEVIEDEVLDGEIVEEAEEMPAELTIEDELAQAQAEAADYKDQYLRARAEFANAKKRMDKERLDTYTNALTDVMKKLLPALDDFDRAIANAPAPVLGDPWFEGIELVQRKMLGILEGLNIVKISAVGEPFDPMMHEGVMQEESDEYDSGIVTKELQTGYRRGDRVIRPALVAVAI
jgi:molecular chaperone GrpE